MNKRGGISLPVLLVDDESTVLESAEAVLQGAGIDQIELFQGGMALMERMRQSPVGVVVLDLFMPNISGTELLPLLVSGYPHVPVIIITAAQDVDIAVNSMKEGAFDYLVKPIDDKRFSITILHALEVRSLKNQVDTLKHYLISDDLRHAHSFSGIISQSRKFRALFQYAEAVAPSPEPILISGETGVGKERFAVALHHLSGLTGRFVQLNVAGLDETLFSDTLFGHRKGAFTGAHQNREGLVAQAVEGTLFLDEIGDLSMASQVKLLRLIQEQRYYQLGSDVPKNSRVRIICATNQRLDKRMQANHFRPDLYYRLSVHQIHIPPLREHKEDIALLVQHFLEEAATSMHKKVPIVPSELINLLENYPFPGNVRELRALIFNAMAVHRTGPFLSMESFRDLFHKQQSDEESPLSDDTDSGENSLRVLEHFPPLRKAESILIREALKRADGNQGTAALLLGISRVALNRRLTRLSLQPQWKHLLNQILTSKAPSDT
ncbi:MAG: sigma-54-dependent Fis family transcriptional regulator [Magnetococcales bacterium]|nr:sigma-54-dependent Fis family transcriptional regulator [Magnetococcales bacterium]